MNTKTLAAAIAATLVFSSGCATETQRAMTAAGQPCGKKQVLYCVESGSRGTDGVCRCLSQEATQNSLNNL
jgi:hypothetical protein